ncbi:FRG domain-containing protein [Luteococcus sanguinis]
MQPESIDQLLAFTMRLTQLGPAVGGYVWRGQADAAWKLESSLQRHMRTNGLADTIPLEKAERALIEQARNWGLGTMGASHIPDLQLLAQMQHHGVPTRLIDVSRDPFTALWFACSDHTSKDGILFAVDAKHSKETHERPEGTLGEIAEPLDHGLKQILDTAIKHPVMLAPTIRDARMTAQQGAFLIGMLPDGLVPTAGSSLVSDCQAFGFLAVPPDFDSILQDPPDLRTVTPPSFAAFIIPAGWKQPLLHVLHALGKSHQTLYPDLAGFALALHHGDVALDHVPKLGEEKNIAEAIPAVADTDYAGMITN